MTDDELVEVIRENADPLGPARGILTGLLAGALLWALFIWGAFEAMKGLA